MGKRSTGEAPEVNVRFDADGLYEIVETYANFGDHHTGSEADRQTTDWLASVLQNLVAETRAGFEVDLPSYDFERYLCTATLIADGQPVPMVPVFYSGRGSFRTDRLQVVELDRSIVGPAESLDELIASGGEAVEEEEEDRALVVALNGPEDLPVQANRVPWPVSELAATNAGRPAVVIPGNWADRVRAGAQLDFEATTETTTSRNLVAELGSPANPGVIITTPLTGWTRCAGERGTGLATALAMAANLASNYRVQFIACSGHELDHIGMQHHLSNHHLSNNDVSGRPVIHLGASVGAVDHMSDGSAPLGAGRATLTTAREPLRSEIAKIASRANWRPIDPPDWPGEGAGWRAAGASVLSFLGGFEHFHVASDLPEVATTPESLELATATAIEAARLFLDRMTATGPGDATQ